MPISPSAARLVARCLSVGRVALGAAAILSPGTVARHWVGEGGDRGRSVLGRALGGRDVALGLGALLAMRHDDPVRGWLEGAALADLVDAGATGLALGELPTGTGVAVMALAAGSAVAGAVAARRVDAGG